MLCRERFLSSLVLHQISKKHIFILTVRSAAPRTALWGGPEPRFEPETGGLEAGTLTSITDHHTSIKKMCITFLRSRVDFLYYDGSPPSYDYEYYNDYNDISKVTILELSRKILPYISNSMYYVLEISRVLQTSHDIFYDLSRETLSY